MLKRWIVVGCMAAFLTGCCNSSCPFRKKAPVAAETAKAAEAPKPVAIPRPTEATKAVETPKVPETPKAQASPKGFVLRVNCGATEPYTDKAGHVWAADQDWGAGKAWGVVDGSTVDRQSLGMTGTDAPRVYELERYSVGSYRFTVPNGTYTVRLHFAETYDGITAAGDRVFSVSIGDQVVLKDLDVFKETGGINKPLVKEYKAVSVANGQLVIGLTSNVQNTEINGIEILGGMTQGSIE